jgi:PPP family 3-phenylpropionic acid transporter
VVAATQDEASVNRFWPFSFYFLYFAALAAFAPYIVLFWQERGFSGAQIGLLTFIPPLATLLVTPLWTGAADAWRQHRLLMAAAVAGAALIVAAAPLVTTFGTAILFVLLFAFVSAPIIAMADAATIGSLAAEGQAQMYGRVRVGGTLGWALAAPLIGALAEARGIPWVFWAYASLMLLGLIVGLRFTFPANTAQGSVWSGMARLVRDRGWAFFLLICLVTGIGFASVNTYLFAYFEELQIGTTLAGLAMTISTVSEIPLLFFANRILGKLGARGMLLLAVAVTGVRLLLYAAVVAPVPTLALQLVNGLTFPTFWVAGVAYANERAPEGMEASAQGLFGAATMGFGAAAGGLLGGLLLGSVGGRAMYAIMGTAVLAGMLLILGAERGTRRR